MSPTDTAKQPLDQATRDLVSRDGLGRTLFVEAGAGTGKTTQLVDRIANLVINDGIRLVNIAAITFTEAAAAELHARIRVKFEQRAADAEGEEEQRCLDALADADLAAISTLHGFASRLLTEFAIEAGLPPRVRVLDEVSSQLAHEDRWARFVDRLYADPAHQAVLTRAALVDAALEPRYQGHATLKDVAAELNDNWDRLGDVATTVPPPLGPIDFSAFDAAVADLVSLADTCTDPSDKFCVHLVQNLTPATSAIVAIEDPNRKLRALAGSERWGPGVGGRNDAWGGDAKGAKAFVAAVNDAKEAVIAGAADEVLRHLLVLIAGEVLAAANDRREEGGLEFHDLLVLAREMLRTSATARASLHDRYTHILLDEFQDTDPIQIELAMRIAASIAGHDASSWHELDVEDGRLFFVGDPKQSIYRFRRADISLFLQARDLFGPDGTWQRLTTNFRTVGPVLDWVNAYFTEIMSEEAEGAQPQYEPLEAWREASPDADHRPVLLGGPHPDAKVGAGELRTIEALTVAQVIADVRDRPDRWPVFDPSLDGWRHAELRDVTVLVPTRTSVPYLREALDAEQLPYRLATGTLVYDTQEVRDALAALAAVDDPTDEMSLVAALRSPLYACSDVDLFVFRQAGGRWDLRRRHPETLADDHPVVAALAHLRSLWEARWWSSPAEMVERLLRERRAFLLGFGDPRPTEVWRRLRFLQDQARAFDEAGGGDLRSFLAWAELQGADGAKVHEPLLPETDDDSVQILTVHGAKGLEFPITILSGMTTLTAGQRRGVSLMWGDDEKPEVRLRKGLATANYEPRADLEVEMDVHEKIRLLYVASTRARDHLIVSCHHKQGKKQDTYAGKMWAYFDEHRQFWQPFVPDGEHRERPAPVEPAASGVDADPAGGVEDKGPDNGADVLAARAAWIAERDALLAPQRTSRVVSATAVARWANDEVAPQDGRAASGLGDVDSAVDPDADVDVDVDVVAERHEDDGLDQLDDRDALAAGDGPATGGAPVWRQGRAGSAIGRAVHATLQVLDLADPHDVDAQVVRQCELESIADLAPTAVRMVRSALASAAVRLAAGSPHHRELYVAAPIGERVVEGYIDLLIETPEGLIVVDYKTDSARSEAEIDAKLATYELQGASYAVALEAVTGQRVVDCRFVFCRPGGAIERSVTDLATAMDRVRATLATAP